MRRFNLAIAILLGTISYANGNTLAEAEQGVKREFRFFRIQVYNSFRSARPEYDRRRAAGDEALTAWKQAGGQSHQAEALITWYRDAKAASLPGAISDLPPLPEFPAALAVAPAPANAKVNVRHDTNRPSPDSGIYRVREVASRSIHNPENVPGDSTKRKKKERAEKSNTVWASVSRALLKSIPLRGSEEK